MNNSLSLKHICFDLDGTITDSFNTIYYATVKTLKSLKITNALSKDQFKERIGYHFKDIFVELGLPSINFDEFITIYKEYYFDFINESNIYPGVTELLNYINNKEIKVSLCTTKVQDQADKIINHFELRRYFSFVMGRREKIADKPSAEPLLFICEKLNVNPQETLMVGDSELDIRCGKNAGAFTCAAAYGYRNLEVIKPECPDFTIYEPNDLKSLIEKITCLSARPFGSRRV